MSLPSLTKGKIIKTDATEEFPIAIIKSEIARGTPKCSEDCHVSLSGYVMLLSNNSSEKPRFYTILNFSDCDNLQCLTVCCKLNVSEEHSERKKEIDYIE